MSPILTGAWRQRPFEAPQHGLYTRHQFARTEWFGDVIVRTQFKAENAVRFAALRGQENYGSGRERRNLPDLAA